MLWACSRDRDGTRAPGGPLRTPWLMVVICMACAEQLAPEAAVVAAPVPEAAPTEAAKLDPEIARSEIEKVVELVQDVAFYHEKEEIDAAAQLWHQAFERWAKALRDPLAAADPSAALALEYRFGALRTALEARRGKPKPITATIVEDLRATAWRLTGDPPPAPPPAAEPPKPPEPASVKPSSPTPKPAAPAPKPKPQSAPTERGQPG